VAKQVGERDPPGVAAGAASSSEYGEEELGESDQGEEEEEEEELRPPSTFSTPLRHAYTQCAPAAHGFHAQGADGPHAVLAIVVCQLGRFCFRS